MLDYELLIAVRDEADLESGHKRKKEGDIIDVRPVEEVEKRGGWGRLERKRYLIVPAKNLDEETANKLAVPLYEDGSYFPPMDEEETDCKEWAAQKAFNVKDKIGVDGWAYICTVAGETGNVKPSFQQEYGKTTIDNSIVWECLGKFNAQIIGKRRHQIPLSIIKTGWHPDLDTSKVQDTEQEYQPLVTSGTKIDFSEKVAIVKDRLKGTFKYSQQKVISA